MKKIVSIVIAICFFSCNNIDKKDSKVQELASDSSNSIQDSVSLFPLEAVYTTNLPVLDGDTTDICWTKSNWFPMNYIWLGEKPTNKEDFNGRFKLVYSDSLLHILAEIDDDKLIDIYQKWDTMWWNDDCLEIFIDEDNGNDWHQFNHKAFAYHVALNGKDVVDMGLDSLPHLFNDHLKCQIKTVGNKTFWELSMKVYTDEYTDGTRNFSTSLTSGKKLGFTLNYCDNDNSKERENFFSSIPSIGNEKDMGWKDASFFNDLELK